MLNGKNVSMDYNKVPIVIYGTPEIAEIGITEDRAKEEGIDVIVNHKRRHTGEKPFH